jgi:hypothetical protein
MNVGATVTKLFRPAIYFLGFPGNSNHPGSILVANHVHFFTYARV